MNAHDHQILSIFATRVRELFPGAVIRAFGSRARGTSAEDSDLDVCIVVPIINDDIDRKIMDIAWDVGFEHDVVISTVTYSRDEFETGPCSQSPLVKVVLKEGIAA